jgi:uncharacterized protein
MAGASQGWHEDEAALTQRTKELHRALVSLEEELEAIDWYQQRIDATQDPELKRILAHNRDEEKEHAMMLLEWLRRHDVAFERQVAIHVGRPGPIAREEPAGEAGGGAAPGAGDGGQKGDR